MVTSEKTRKRRRKEIPSAVAIMYVPKHTSPSILSIL